MAKYIKKPVAIEAIKWTGGNHREMFEFLGGSSSEAITGYGDNFYIDHNKGAGGLVIKTSEGDMLANIGDYIIKEPFDKERAVYPCKTDVFAATYYTEQEYAELK